jgi:hypothetical protein
MSWISANGTLSGIPGTRVSFSLLIPKHNRIEPNTVARGKINRFRICYSVIDEYGIPRPRHDAKPLLTVIPLQNTRDAPVPNKIVGENNIAMFPTTDGESTPTKAENLTGHWTAQDSDLSL